MGGTFRQCETCGQSRFGYMRHTYGALLASRREPSTIDVYRLSDRQSSPAGPWRRRSPPRLRIGHRLQSNIFHFDRSKFLKGGAFTMREDPNVLVELHTRQAEMFVASWVFTRPKQFQDDLLNHEQGHYEIGMLNASDFFSELENIQGSSFASGQAGWPRCRTCRRPSGVRRPSTTSTIAIRATVLIQGFRRPGTQL